MHLLGSPGRTLVAIVAFMLALIVLSTLAYMAAGWSFTDASYMVLLTVYSVGYSEVHTIDTPYLHVITVGTMILGCTGVILLTGALVQFLTINQLQHLFGVKRMIKEIDHLGDHVIVVGFGRIGVMLTKELKTGGKDFVIVDKDDKLAAEARALGYLCVVGDATDESSLQAAGIARARILASVLPNDAANVFITLTARSLNSQIEIIARGEKPTTENKLLQAGANHIILPTHIGAERIAEMILYPETKRFLHTAEDIRETDRTLQNLGLEMQVIVVPENGPLTNLSIEEIETRTMGQFFVVQLNRRDGEVLPSPERSLQVNAGDGLVIVGRGGQASRAMFEAAPEQSRAEPQTFTESF